MVVFPNTHLEERGGKSYVSEENSKARGGIEYSELEVWSAD